MTFWPTERSLGNKLHGTATEQRLTVRHIARRDYTYNKSTSNAEEEEEAA